MMRNMIKSSLSELRVVPKTTPPQSQSNSIDRVKKPSQDTEDSSEGEEEITSDHGDPKLDQGKPELDQGNP